MNLISTHPAVTTIRRHVPHPCDGDPVAEAFDAMDDDTRAEVLQQLAGAAASSVRDAIDLVGGPEHLTLDTLNTAETLATLPATVLTATETR